MVAGAFCPAASLLILLAGRLSRTGYWVGAPNDKTVGGYNPGWFIYSGTGSSNTYAGYLVATTNRSENRVYRLWQRNCWAAALPIHRW